MSIDLYLGFVLASAVLMMIPGPNMSLIVANSVAYGARYGMLTLAGTAGAMVPQLIATGLGLTTTLHLLADWFDWIRWIGVVYLIYLGVRQWRAIPVDLTRITPQPRSARVIVLRGFLVSLTNPKTLLFFGAFFPQFVSLKAPVLPQVALLSVTFLVVAIVLDSCWALLAARLRGVLAAHGRLRNRVAGGCLIGAGLGLVLARQ